MRHHHRHHGQDDHAGRHGRPASEQSGRQGRSGRRRRFGSDQAGAEPVARAVHNLKAAIHKRLAQEGLEPAAIADIAGLIERAALKVEGV